MDAHDSFAFKGDHEAALDSSRSMRYGKQRKNMGRHWPWGYSKESAVEAAITIDEGGEKAGRYWGERKIF